MNKRGFTLIELLGVIILLGIITTIATLGYSSYLTGTRKKAFAIEEKNFVSATRSAYADCESNKTDNSFCNNHETLETKYMYQFVYLKELVDDNYIKIIKDPYDVEKVCDVEKSYVYTSLRNNLEEDNNSEIVYKACLICGDHKSEDCLSEDLDYSSFETTCKAYYDVAGSEIYDGKWTDRTVVLEFGASGNFRYGINNYVYTVGGAGRTSIDASNNMASVNINYDVASKEYNVQAYDGMNKKGTNVSCGTVKIDKGTINSVSLSGVTASGNKVVSNTWVNEQVTLIASVNPDKSVSGYVYQWYLNGEKYGSATSSNKLVVTKSGTYKVEVTNQVGKIRKESNNFIVKLDNVVAPTIQGGSGSWLTQAPTISIKTNGTAASGVKHYEYYKTNSSTAPNANTQATGTTSNTLTVSDNGTTYIYYRTVSNGGNKSSWSNVQIVNLESVTPPTIQGGSGNWLTQAPTISIKTNGTAASGVKHYEYYKTRSSTTPNANTQATGTTSNTLTVSDNGTTYIYYRTVSNGGNKSSWSNVQTVILDTVDPKVSASVVGKNVIFTFSDNIGVTGYSVNQSSTGVTSWISTSVTTITWTATSAGTYYVWVRDASGRTGKSAFTIEQNAFCAYTPGAIWEYNYTGGVQTFTVPCNGTYKLEVYGAQGGNNVGIGGKGGYAYGNVSLNKPNSLYIYVGGQGVSASITGSYDSTIFSGGTGGYNGGGNGKSFWHKDGVSYEFHYNLDAGGGGATHIATTNRGILANYKSYQTEVLLVAGGGGGAYYNDEPNENGDYDNIFSVDGGAGGTAGGYDFGTGQSGQFNYGTGGGGGWSSGLSGGDRNASTGGTNYIGNLTNSSSQSGIRAGNGYAKITLVTINQS